MKALINIAILFLIIVQMAGCSPQLQSFIQQQTFCTTLSTYVPSVKSAVYDPVTKTLVVSWDPVLCATQYQLEWTFASANDSTLMDGSWKPDFRFNATRIVTPELNYSIPIVYDDGILIYRIRCVRMIDSLNQALFSPWSPVFPPGIHSGAASMLLSSYSQIYGSLVHEDRKLNWQYSTSYSDDGKRRDQVKYMDGTLRPRQVVSVSNTDTISLATNIIYDNEGRPAINTIPAPVIMAGSLPANNQYAHHLGYFPKQVLAAPDTVYTYRQFDLDRFAVRSDSCSPALLQPRPVSSESGASRYFSVYNQDKAEWQGKVPDAGGFPFVQTQWADDNTNRVIRQSMPGDSSYIGTNHETGFRYADVAQDEIDMLFGNDAGNERYYKKMIRIDPNGQQSVEYTRVDGKVVATALAGPVPRNLDAIPTQVVPINVDIVGSEQTAAADGLSKFSTKTFDLSNDASCSFGYRLLPRNFAKSLCGNTTVCLDCRYRVQLLLKDQNGNILQQVDTAIGTLLQNCTTGNAPVYRNLFTKILCKGNYTVTRNLVVDTAAFDNYFQSYLKKADSCGDVSVVFPIPEKTTGICQLTCEQCKALPDSLKVALKDYCEMICNKGFASPCEQARQMMLINLSPGGQYAEYDMVMGNVNAGKYPLSIYYNGKWRTLTTTPPSDLRPYIANNDLNGLVQHWKSEWAAYFLPLHPEYCYYRYCVDNEPAYIQNKQFNDKLLEVPNAKIAIASGLISPQNTDPSPNAFGIYAIVKQKLDNYRNGMPLSAFIYSGFQNCKSVPPYNNNFANTPDTFANNMQWQMFRALYIGIKNQLIDSLREIYVKQKCGGYCNKCIGDSLNYYAACNPPTCNIPVDTICKLLKKKYRLFPSTFSYQELLPFRLTGVDSLDLDIIRNYTDRHLPKLCRCEKHEQIESLFRYVIAKKKLAGTITIPDTLCSVGLAYETIPGYKGDVTWEGIQQPGGSLIVNLNDTLNKSRCTLHFISIDSLIPWNKIVLMSCLRTNRIPAQFKAGPNLFLIDLYDSSFRKYTAEVQISCIDTASCKTTTGCKPVYDPNHLREIFECAVTKGVVRNNLFIVTINIGKEKCEYTFDLGKDIVYAGAIKEVISIEPERGDAKDNCKLYGVKMIVKITVEERSWYITVHGKPGKNCFVLAECCKQIPPPTCKPTHVRDSINLPVNFKGLVWSRPIALDNSGYYYFSFRMRGDVNDNILKASIDLRIDKTDFNKQLTVTGDSKNGFIVGARIPLPFRRTHLFELSITNADLIRKGGVRVHNFSVTPENCDDCCLPVFPPLPPYTPEDCDSSRIVVDNYNVTIIRTQYLAELRDKLKLEFIGHCLSNIDSFGLRYSDALYHFTLYYYDQAANLVATVPPKGVHLLPADSVLKVQQHRRNAASPAIYPSHSFKSVYNFNSLNNVTLVTTPDAGTTHNWYDPLGRLVVRQQARQAATGAFDYILYDHFSRIIQNGAFIKPGADIPSLVRDSILFANTLRASERHEVKTNIYDQPLVDSINGPGSVYRKKIKPFGDTLNYTRQRMAATFLYDTIPAGSSLSPGNYRNAIHYWYDMQGYVRMMIHEIPALAVFGQQLKAVAYDYELLNGLTKKVKYQPGEADKFYTRYTYDADKRITQVATSLNDTVWVRDARYNYYKHGMLARMDLGDDSVQRFDYAHTIQGWVRSVNSDVFGFELGYYKNDYRPIDGSLAHASVFDSLHIANGLFSGNIRYQTIKRNDLRTSIYAYDQLNRLTSSKVDTTADYDMKLTYDDNGNIQTLARNGNMAMDALTYHYNAANNHLGYIADTVNANNYNNDIDNQQALNYAYDASGNLTKDRSEKIDSILWNASGKIKRIIKDTGEIAFTYTAPGHRLSKSSNGRTSWYISDMQGIVLATYRQDTSGLVCTAHPIYGSKRLGVYNQDSTKQYELTDHLGNVLLTINDHQVVTSATDYYPFGMEMPGRSINAGAYRYSYNGKEKDDDVKGTGNSLDFGARIYDPRAGRFLSVDPKAGSYAGQTPYSFSDNNPVLLIDENGEAAKFPPGYITAPMLINHPVDFFALVGSNNSSPLDFYEWVKSHKHRPITMAEEMDENGQFNKFKGVFGEAEVWERLMTDWEFTGTELYVPIPLTMFGQYYRGEQVDIQQAWILLEGQTVAIRNYNADGVEQDLEIRGGHPQLFIINYEVKTLSPKSTRIYDDLMDGVRQLKKRAWGNSVAGVLVTDKESFMKLKPSQRAKIVKDLKDNNSFLRLEENLESNARASVIKNYDVVKEAEQKRKKKKKDVEEEEEEVEEE